MKRATFTDRLRYQPGLVPDRPDVSPAGPIGSLCLASNPDLAFGVHLNPDKAIPVTFAEHDRIIVLAEE